MSYELEARRRGPIGQSTEIYTFTLKCQYKFMIYSVFDADKYIHNKNAPIAACWGVLDVLLQKS